MVCFMASCSLQFFHIKKQPRFNASVCFESILLPLPSVLDCSSSKNLSEGLWDLCQMVLMNSHRSLHAS